MAEKYISIQSEASGYGTLSTGAERVFFKILSETVHSRRDDFYPETQAYWTPESYVRGPSSVGGDIEVLVEPYQFTKLLVYHLGTPSTSTVLSGTVYAHAFSYGGTEKVSLSGLQSFTLVKGDSVEKDRQFDGTFITDIETEARAAEVVAGTISVVGKGSESLITASSANYITYSGRRYLTFADASVMTVGGSSRLTADPTIESFTLRLPRGYDTEHRRLGSPYIAAQTLHGVAIPEGTMDFTFTNKDEHERFLSHVGATSIGAQSGFITVLTLAGDTISSGYTDQITISIPETRYTASEAAVTGRDRIVQTVNYRGNYHALSGHSVMITVQNATSAYTTLTNAL